MLPPGMSFNAVGDKALAASKTSKMPKSFFAWDDMLNMNKIGFFPYTPATQMLQGLAVGIEMLHEEGLDNVFARHDRLAEATRRAVKAWGLENLNKNAAQVSPTITAGCCRRATTPTSSARWRWRTSTSPTAPASAPMPASISASAISATSTTAC
jgi:aspartate aminotransferase-like enzyme